MKTPITTLQHHLIVSSVDMILVSNPLNIRYLTGFFGVSPDERESILSVTPTDTHLFIPRMYEEQARKLPITTDSSVHVVVHTERSSLLMLFTSHLPPMKHILVETDDLKVDEFEEIKKCFKGTISSCEIKLHDLRMIKTTDELEMIQRAVTITDNTWTDLLTMLSIQGYTKFTELDIVDHIRTMSRSHGGEGFGFEPIVACGTISSEPHYVSRPIPLKKNSVLLVDMGIRYHGYTGDLTRCIYLGLAPTKVHEIYNLVYSAHDSALSAIRNGAVTGDIHQSAMQIFEQKKVAHNVLHSTGHGVGLAIHEPPYLRKNATDVLKTDMTITVEPGLYFPGEFGIRIEDLVVVTENGYRQLSQPAPKRLVEI